MDFHMCKSAYYETRNYEECYRIVERIEKECSGCGTFEFHTVSNNKLVCQLVMMIINDGGNPIFDKVSSLHQLGYSVQKLPASPSRDLTCFVILANACLALLIDWNRTKKTHLYLVELLLERCRDARRNIFGSLGVKPVRSALWSSYGLEERRAFVFFDTTRVLLELSLLIETGREANCCKMDSLVDVEGDDISGNAFLLHEAVFNGISLRDWERIVRLLTSLCLNPSDWVKDTSPRHCPTTRGRSKSLILYLEGLNDMQAGDLVDVLKISKSLLSEGISNCMKGACYSLIGRVHSLQGQRHLAITRYRSALQLDSSSFLPLRFAADTYRAMNRYEYELESLNLLSMAMHIEYSKPGFTYTDLETLVHGMVKLYFECTYPRTLYKLSSRCLHLKHFDVAKEKYEELMSLVSIDSYARASIPPISIIHHELCILYLITDDLEKAWRVCDELLKDKNDVLGGFMKAKCYIKEGRIKESRIAMNEDKRCAVAVPSSVFRLLLEALGRAIRNMPVYLKLILNIFSVLRQLDHIPCASLFSEDWREILKGIIYFEKGQLLCKDNLLQDAFLNSQCAVSSKPDCLAYMIQHVNLLLRMGQPEAARDNWRVFRKRQGRNVPDDIELCVRLLIDLLPIDQELVDRFDDLIRDEIKTVEENMKS